MTLEKLETEKGGKETKGNIYTYSLYKLAVVFSTLMGSNCHLVDQSHCILRKGLQHFVELSGVKQRFARKLAYLGYMLRFSK